MITGVHAYNINAPILMSLKKNLDYVGAPSFTDKEQEWAKKLQEATQKEQKGFDTKIKSIPDNWEKIVHPLVARQMLQK